MLLERLRSTLRLVTFGSICIIWLSLKCLLVVSSRVAFLRRLEKKLRRSTLGLKAVIRGSTTETLLFTIIIYIIIFTLYNYINMKPL